MSDKRAEARRRRILENPSKRLEKLQKLSNVEDTNTEAETRCGQTTHPLNHLEDHSNVVEDDDKDTCDADCDSYKDIVQEDDAYGDSAINTDTEKKVSLVDDKKPSWLMRKYRLILFILLAWSIYMVVAKEFDFVLGYLIGQRLPNDLLPTLILTVFIFVELQVMVASLLLQKSDETQPNSMVCLALSLCGIPKNFMNLFGKISSMFISAVTDFCVYVFVLVLLKTLDEKV